MTYQVLARKWRPTTFSEVAGQSHVLKSLVNALDNERLHHAYLFTGTRGVGKTTLARILAKCLNCEQGVSSTPCGKCGACSEISDGRFIDLIEVDAAIAAKVEETRELLENVQYTPARGRYKVYLIDEVHMLSRHSFNALLKTLEEPPPHVKFLLATTDPQKLPVTILSRCLQFHLKNLSPKQITEYLVTVLKDEKIKHDDDALWQIATAAAGSMRDALTLVDQAIAYCQGKLQSDSVVEMLGIPKHTQVRELLEAMASKNLQQVLDLAANLSERTPDYSHTLDSLLSALHRIAIAQVLPDGVDNSFGDRDMIVRLAGEFTAEDVQLYYQIGSRGRADLRQASDMREAFEMLLLRMLVFSPRFAADVAQAPQAVQAPQPAKAEKKKHEAAEPSPAASAAVNDTLDNAKWQKLVPRLPANGLMANILGNCTLQKTEGDTLYLLLDEAQQALYKDKMVPRLESILSDYFNRPMTVQVDIGAATEETPASHGRRLNSEHRARMTEVFNKDQRVQQLLQQFNGKIHEVQPVD